MSVALPQAGLPEDREQNQRMYLQLGFFLAALFALTFASEMTSAYAPSCSGVANLSGPLLPVAA